MRPLLLSATVATSLLEHPYAFTPCMAARLVVVSEIPAG